MATHLKGLARKSKLNEGHIKAGGLQGEGGFPYI